MDEIIKIVVNNNKVNTCDPIAFVNRIIKDVSKNTDISYRNRKVLIDLGFAEEYLYSDRGGYKMFYIRLTSKGNEYLKQISQ